jgi:hypothetical protein
MPKETVEIPVPVLSTVQSLDGTFGLVNDTKSKDHGRVGETRRQDLAGEFMAWKPRHVSWPTESK